MDRVPAERRDGFVGSARERDSANVGTAVSEPATNVAGTAEPAVDTEQRAIGGVGGGGGGGRAVQEADGTLAAALSGDGSDESSESPVGVRPPNRQATVGAQSAHHQSTQPPAAVHGQREVHVSAHGGVHNHSRGGAARGGERGSSAEASPPVTAARARTRDNTSAGRGATASGRVGAPRREDADSDERGSERGAGKGTEGRRRRGGRWRGDYDEDEEDEEDEEDDEEEGDDEEKVGGGGGGRSRNIRRSVVLSSVRAPLQSHAARKALDAASLPSSSRRLRALELPPSVPAPVRGTVGPASESPSSELEKQLTSHIMLEKMMLARNRTNAGVGGIGDVGRTRMFHSGLFDHAGPVQPTILSANNSPKAPVAKLRTHLANISTAVDAVRKHGLMAAHDGPHIRGRPAGADGAFGNGRFFRGVQANRGETYEQNDSGDGDGHAAGREREMQQESAHERERVQETERVQEMENGNGDGDKGLGHDADHTDDSSSNSDAAHVAADGTQSETTTQSDGTSRVTTDTFGRPHVCDIEVDDLGGSDSLPAFATAADAEIGRQMYAQEAYTAQTISHEVQTQKADFGAFIDNLIALMKLRTDVLQTKLSVYKAYFRNVQILIFIGSATIALITGFRVMYAAFQEDSQPLLQDAHETMYASNVTEAGAHQTSLKPAEVMAFDLAVFVLSTAMGLLTTIATFRGWAKKADDMSMVYARAQMVVLALADSQLQIKFIGAPEQMQLLRSTFFAREFKMYADLMRTMADHITFRTLTKHLPAQYDLNVQFLQDDTEYQADLLSIYVDNQRLLRDAASRYRFAQHTPASIPP